MLSTGAITRLSDAGVRSNNQWTPNQLYSGYAKTIKADGSIEVIINNRSFLAQANKSAQPGDFLSLRLLGTDPQPHFAVIDVLKKAMQEAGKLKTQPPWQEAVTLLRQQQPGTGSLNLLWQQYPEQLARFSAHLPGLLAAIKERTLNSEDLSKSGKLKALALSSGSQFDQGLVIDADGEELTDLKSLLLRVLSSLQNHKHLTQHQGKAVLLENGPAAATIQDKTIALYTTSQDAEPQNNYLKQLLTINAENALLQITNGQLQAASRSTPDNSLWIMQLLINYAHHLLPVELEVSRQMQMAREVWQVAFSINLPRAGKLHADITVKNPAVVIHLQCANAEMRELCNDQRTGLRKTLAKCGLTLEEFTCIEGTA